MVASANRFDHCQRFESEVMRRLISGVQIVPDHVYGAPERIRTSDPASEAGNSQSSQLALIDLFLPNYS